MPREDEPVAIEKGNAVLPPSTSRITVRGLGVLSPVETRIYLKLKAMTKAQQIEFFREHGLADSIKAFKKDDKEARTLHIYRTLMKVVGPGKILIMIGGRGKGKCIRRGSLVDTSAGLIPIEKIRPGIRVQAYDSDLCSFRESEVAAVINQGIQKTKKLVTDGNHKLEATPEHPLWTPGGWAQMASLKIGDYIGVKEDGGLRWTRIRELSDGQAEVWDIVVPELHNFVAEGIICHNTSTISWFMDFLLALPNTYFLTNQIFFQDELAKPEWAPLFKPIPGIPGKIAKINPVSNSNEALRKICHIRSHWMDSFTREDSERYRRNEQLPTEPWIIFFLDEATNFMNKMRAAKEENVIMQSWVDMIRKFGVGMVFIYHFKKETTYFLQDNLANVDGIATKLRRPLLKIEVKKSQTSLDEDKVPLLIDLIPPSVLPWDSKSPASFDPALFPQSKTKFTLSSAWKVLQNKQIDSERAPRVLLKVLDVATTFIDNLEQDEDNIELSVAGNIRTTDGRRPVVETGPDQEERWVEEIGHVVE